uniref:Uncharacterized protein n=1 Tax=uncultured prokaryote TaxID=198431 RepID=A0A0H5PXM8_9ZZZZ|nr:hypothetical protein [uncultured prokaryote]
MMVKRRMLSLFLALVVLLSIPMTAFAMSYEDSSANAEQGIIAEETFSIPVTLSLEELECMQTELEEWNIPYSIQDSRAVAIVDVSTRIHYVDELYFSIIAQCSTTLLQKITGSIVWKYKTTGAYSTKKTITVDYSDSFGIPKYTLTCLKYTGKTFASGTTISADFNIDVDAATGEISGGVVSRTVTGVVP